MYCTLFFACLRLFTEVHAIIFIVHPLLHFFATALHFCDSRSTKGAQSDGKHAAVGEVVSAFLPFRELIGFPRSITSVPSARVAPFPSLAHSVTLSHSLTHLHTYSLTHSLTQSPTPPIHLHTRLYSSFRPCSPAVFISHLLPSSSLRPCSLSVLRTSCCAAASPPPPPSSGRHVCHLT